MFTIQWNGQKEIKVAFTKNPIKVCTVPGCDHPHEAKGLCNGHYLQMKKFGRIKRVSLMRDKNKFIRDGETYRIELMDIHGNVVGFAIIGADDYEKCKDIKWHLGRHGYAQNIHKGLKLQHLVFGEKTLLDHRNRNRLDCRKSNLRPCTYQENAMNRGLQGNNTSGFIGVCWHKKARKWSAAIKIGRKNIHLGLFSTKEDAAMARDKAALRLHGKFAKLNFVKEVGV